MKPSWQPTLPPFRENKKALFKSLIKSAEYIYQIGETPALREPSTPVDIKKLTTEEYAPKIKYLKSCLAKYRKLTGKGRGLAGAQVGINEQILVIYMPERKDKFLVVINPTITKESQERLRFYEGCMSAAPAFAPVVRPAWIEFEFVDEHGKKQVWATKADTEKGKIENRVLQHEIDHLNGVINIDRVQSKEIIYESDPDFYKKTIFQKVKEKA